MNKGKKEYTVSEDDGGIRFDRWVRRHYPNLSYIYVLKIIRIGLVLLDGKKFKPEGKINEGQVVTVSDSVLREGEEQKKPVAHVSFTDKKLIDELLKSIIYQDDDLIVLNKPSGLAVQGGTGIKHNIDELAEHLKFGYEDKPKLVHRLDKDTSGLLLLARKTKMAAELGALFQKKFIEKKYLAIVHGVPKEKSGNIEGELVKAWEDGVEKMTNDPTALRSKKSLTLYKVLDYVHNKAALMEFTPMTGRTHQIRKHASQIGHPIVGDDKYGDREKNKLLKANKYLYLHAYELSLPYKSSSLKLRAPLPKHMKVLMDRLGFRVNATL